MTYHHSWLFPIQFSFLPVYRLAILLQPPSCVHGQCLNYINHPHRTYCRCYYLQRSKSSIDIRYTEEYGEQQWNSTRLHISFHRSLNIPTSLIIHLITVLNTEEHNRTTLMKQIGFSYDSVTISTTISFNIILGQILNQYYLLVLYEQTIK